MTGKKEPLREIESLLASADAESVGRGLRLLREALGEASSEKAPLLEVLTSLFYVDPLERPDLAPLLEEAIEALAGCGAWAIPLLVEKLDAGDLKAQLAAAYALGRMGAEAVEPLLSEYRRSPEPARRAFVLYALGKVKSPAVLEAAPLLTEACASPDRELRDTATRAVGKLVESISPAALPDGVRRSFLGCLRRNLADASPAIRAKAVRSLGKLARFGYLEEGEREDLRRVCERILGLEVEDWDRAYIVRREAEEALRSL